MGVKEKISSGKEGSNCINIINIGGVGNCMKKIISEGGRLTLHPTMTTEQHIGIVHGGPYLFLMVCGGGGPYQNQNHCRWGLFEK